MPVHTPGRRAGSGAALRQVKRAMEVKASRSLYATLNLTSMVDFMSVVVIFLLMQFSASGDVLMMQADIVIPEGTHNVEIERVPVVGISPVHITVEGEPVDNTALLLSDPDTRPMEQLAIALKREKDLQKEIHPDEPFTGKFIVQAHEDVNFKAIRRVVETAAEQGFTSPLFAIRLGVAEGTPGK